VVIAPRPPSRIRSFRDYRHGGEEIEAAGQGFALVKTRDEAQIQAAVRERPLGHRYSGEQRQRDILAGTVDADEAPI
jgi:hypothetical protein